VEFLATADDWFRPVNLAHGPDGALGAVLGAATVMALKLGDGLEFAERFGFDGFGFVFVIKNGFEFLFLAEDGAECLGVVQG